MKSVIIALLIVCSFPAFAINDSTKKEMLILMKTRAELFQAYSNSLNKKSGFFGNRTKNDLKTSHDQLKAIVEEDNKIMDALARTLEYRTFEKTTMTFDAHDYIQRIQSLTVVNDTLSRQSQLLAGENKLMKAEISRYRFYNMALIVLSVLLAGVLILKKK